MGTTHQVRKNAAPQSAIVRPIRPAAAARAQQQRERRERDEPAQADQDEQDECGGDDFHRARKVALTRARRATFAARSPTLISCAVPERRDARRGLRSPNVTRHSATNAACTASRVGGRAAAAAHAAARARAARRCGADTALRLAAEDVAADDEERDVAGEHDREPVRAGRSRAAPGPAGRAGRGGSGGVEQQRRSDRRSVPRPSRGRRSRRARARARAGATR